MQTAAVIIVNAILLCFSLYVECVLRRAVWFMGYSHSLVVVFSTAACTMLARRPSCCKPQTLQQSGRWWLWVGRRQCGARTSCRSRRMISATVPAELSLCFVNDSMFLLLFICALATQPLAICLRIYVQRSNSKFTVRTQTKATIFAVTACPIVGYNKHKFESA